MLIKYASRVRAKRETICRGDEATVRRLHTASLPQYDGMVERVQTVDAKDETRMGQEFGLWYKYGRLYTPKQHEVSYHIEKFLALRAARTLFPAHFVNVSELRVWTGHNGIHTAVYSDFVSDDNGVIERRGNAMRTYYGRAYHELARSGDNTGAQFIEEANGIERRMNPELNSLAAYMADAGILIPHPEANYQVSGRNTVFFEIYGIDLTKFLEAAKYRDITIGVTHAIEAISAIYALEVIREARRRLDHALGVIRRPEGEPDHVRLEDETVNKCRQIIDAELHGIYDIVFNILKTRWKFIEPHVFIRDGINHWRSMSDIALKDGKLATPCRFEDIIDPKLHGLLKKEGIY
ncbi:hypothetical protein H0O02_01745 [Candidatus Micrarchaeota archaeon]|nr:hypothetical protein [Candidatus Micrarchaeota archaeon]